MFHKKEFKIVNDLECKGSKNIQKYMLKHFFNREYTQTYLEFLCHNVNYAYFFKLKDEDLFGKGEYNNNKRSIAKKGLYTKDGIFIKDLMFEQHEKSYYRKRLVQPEVENDFYFMELETKKGKYFVESFLGFYV